MKQTINIWDDAAESSLNKPFNRTLLWLEACSIQAFLHYKVVTSINSIHFNYTLLNSINYARTLTHQRQELPDAASEPVAPRQTSHWAASPKGFSLKHRESHIWVKQTTFWFTVRPKTAQTFHPCKLAFWFLPSLSLTFKIKGSRRRIEGSISWTTAGRRSRCAICPGGEKKFLKDQMEYTSQLQYRLLQGHCDE